LKTLLKLSLIVACSLTLPCQGLADSLLVGSNLSTASNGGAVLCPLVSDCNVRAEQFTLSSSTVINDVQVLLSNDGPTYNPNGSFSLGIGTQLGGSSTLIGSGNLAFSPNGNTTSQLFDFSNLDITLGPGTYYLDFSGADAEIDYAQPLLSSYGTLGTQFACDPTEQACGISNSWDTESNNFGPYAVDLNGTVVTPDGAELDAVSTHQSVVTPEPSTLILSATGILALVGVTRRKLLQK
jgi:PEP-CTERM motif